VLLDPVFLIGATLGIAVELDLVAVLTKDLLEMQALTRRVDVRG
jgi:hypothetical protein